jgi:hypothetical protein
VCISHRRARIGVTEAILSSRHRNTLAIHHGLVPVAKGMEPATLDPELLEQGIEFPLPNEIRVPRRSVARGEEQTEPVRSPGAKVSALPDCYIRTSAQLCDRIILACFRTRKS